jgi:hypothetical protein
MAMKTLVSFEQQLVKSIVHMQYSPNTIRSTRIFASNNWYFVFHILLKDISLFKRLQE